ncbi:hypothetical protein L873DRAFT_1442042 [Choiromyces venosus 120613-1]|uniref:Transmembrane protein n=1 Tax=Choiromyces venosus 120613-1 TaxID=1336337 RepID=A0A3N4JC57_9PEZI|nr:hypothetical protein L873DRAFT_1442042 [Choiromyces venosus 120613-1]
MGLERYGGTTLSARGWGRMDGRGRGKAGREWEKREIVMKRNLRKLLRSTVLYWSIIIIITITIIISGMEMKKKKMANRPPHSRHVLIVETKFTLVGMIVITKDHSKVHH